jgi:hypothetical protein
MKLRAVEAFSQNLVRADLIKKSVKNHQQGHHELMVLDST